MENIFVEFLPPWVETGLQPAFYDKESGTVLQQTARMYARVNMLIRMFNKLSKNTKEEIERFETSVNETVANYIEQFNQLHDYVHDYFDNLDVQQEINNKLDAMVEAGTLQEIIADYLNSKAVFGYDTVADMKSATNLIDGSYARTLGYYAKNDGGEALFKIRTISNDDVVDETLIYEMDGDNNLVAELIIDDSMNVKQFGIKSDGTTDNTTKMNRVLSLGRNTLYFPDGTYLFNSILTINNCRVITGQSLRNTVIKAPDGFVSWDSNGSQRLISNMTIDGVSAGDSNVGIEGIFAFSKLENLNIRNYYIAFKPLPGSWINNFDNISIFHCTNGIYCTDTTTFNDNTFTNCVFQGITGDCVRVTGDVNNFIGCDFEGSHNCFHRVGRNLNINGCYIEGNDRILDIDNPSYLSEVTIEKSWLAPKNTSLIGWLACFYTVADANTQTASLLVIDSDIRNLDVTAKPFSFQTTDGNKSYWGVSLQNNSYFNIVTNNSYQPYYADLFDTTNCTTYGKTQNMLTFTSDIPLYKYSGIYAFRKSLGNKRSAVANNQMMELKGHYTVEQSSGTITVTPDHKYANTYPQLNNIPVYVKYADNTVGIGRMSVDAANFYIYPDYNGRTTSEIIFDCSYIKL